MGRIKTEITREREKVMLAFVVAYFRKNRIGPTHDEILEHFALVLGKREIDGAPVVRYKQQTKRLINSLRKQGLLIPISDHRHRAIVPTEYGEYIVRQQVPV